MLLFIHRDMATTALTTLPLERLGVTLPTVLMFTMPRMDKHRTSCPDAVKKTGWVSKLFLGNYFCEETEQDIQHSEKFPNVY